MSLSLLQHLLQLSHALLQAQELTTEKMKRRNDEETQYDALDAGKAGPKRHRAIAVGSLWCGESAVVADCPDATVLRNVASKYGISRSGLRHRSFTRDGRKRLTTDPKLGPFGEAFIWKVPNGGPIFLAGILVDLDWDALAIKPVAAVSLGT